MQKDSLEKDTLMRTITELFRSSGNRPMKVKEMAGRLGIPAEAYRSFRNRVRALYKDNLLVRGGKGRWLLRGGTERVEGGVGVGGGGSALGGPGGGREDVLFIRRADRRGSVSGDRGRVLVQSGFRGGREGRGRVVEILERAHPVFSGRLARYRGKYLVRPHNPKIDREAVLLGDMKGIKEGDIVTVKVTDWGRGERFVRGTAERVFSNLPPGEADILSILLEYDLPLEFPEEVREEAERISGEIDEGEVAGRLDCRSLRTFTIDPVDARDYDDALSVEPLDGGRWRVGIHIADVAHYVKIGSAIDREALRRGTSVYLVDRAIPMLPERLSGDLCSLRPGEDRLTRSVFVELDREGRVHGSEMRETIIRSCSRLTYDEAQAIIDETERPAIHGLEEDLFALFQLSEARARRRMEEGSLAFDRPEAFIIFNEKGVPLDVRKAIQLASHRLVEQFMVLANRLVAIRLEEAGVPLIFRIHERPSEEDLEILEERLRNLGLGAPWRKSGIAPGAFQRILQSVRGKKEEPLVIELVLRSMKRARYSVENPGHFGLALDRYSHFTSPIRRYPDLTVHRQVEALLSGGKPAYSREGSGGLREISEGVTERERIADQAEWDSIDLKKVQFMEERLGEVFTGTISNLIPVGLFVLLDEFFIEGMVAFRTLDDDRYDLIEEHFLVRGQRTGRTFRIGDRVLVQVARADRLRRQFPQPHNLRGGAGGRATCYPVRRLLDMFTELGSIDGEDIDGD